MTSAVVIYAVADPSQRVVWFTCQAHRDMLLSQNPRYSWTQARFRTYCGFCTSRG